jgi:hypothetical protein
LVFYFSFKGVREVAKTPGPNPFKPVRETWAPNGEEGWYIGPSLNHYRCVNCYYPRTRAEQHTDTVVFFPSTVKIPEVDLKDFLHQAALDIISKATARRCE